MDVMDLKSEKFTFDTVVKRFEAEKAQLFRPDGAKKYGDKEHAEKLAALLEPVTRWHDKVKEKCAAAETAARMATALEHSDPITTLSDSELQRAFFLKPFVESAVNSLPLSDLAKRLSAVVATGDKATIACYQQAAAQRTQAQREAYRAGDQGALEGLSAIAEHVDALSAKLANPKHAEAMTDAIELRKAAAEISFETNQRLRELNGEQEASDARRKSEYQSMF